MQGDVFVVHFSSVDVIKVPEAGKSGPEGAGDGAKRGCHGFVDDVGEAEKEENEQRED